MSLEAKEIEDARLVDKFMAEMKKANSPLRIDYTKAIKLPRGEQRDAEITRVLKKHGYENLSPAKLAELLHERPQDVSQIKPPILVDKEIASKPKFEWDLFTGIYMITSDAPTSPIKPITAIGARAEDVSWVEDGLKKEFKPTTKVAAQVAPDGTETWDYWVEWGDKESEWFSAQFFGVSAAKKKPTFVGFRYIKGIEKPLPFNGVQTDKANKDDADFWVNITEKVAIGIILLGVIGCIIYKYRRWQAKRLEDALKEEENRNMEEQKEKEFLEGVEREEKEVLEKEVKEMLDKSDAKHERDLAEKMTEKIEALDFGEIAADGKLTEAQKSQVDALMKAEMKQLVNEQYGSKSKEIQARLSKQEGFAERVIEAALTRFEKASAWNPQLAKFEGSVGHMVESNLIARHVEAITLQEQKKLNEIKEMVVQGRGYNSKAYDALQYLRTQMDLADPEQQASTIEKYEKEVAKLKAEGEVNVEKVHDHLIERSGKRFEAKHLREELEKGKEKAKKAKLEAQKAMEAVKRGKAPRPIHG
ncbi:hypothetical protein ACHAQJ_002912 [Trichoderma viride]